MALTCGEQWYGQDKSASTHTLGPLVFVLYGCTEPETVLLLMFCWETDEASLCSVNELLPDNRLFRSMRNFSCESQLCFDFHSSCCCHCEDEDELVEG